MKHWATVYRVSWVVLAVLAVLVAITLFSPRFRRLRELHKEKLRQEEQIRNMEARLEELKASRERFAGDRDFVERMAREAGMVKRDETLVKYTNTQSRTPRPVP
jgi:cell division protein FtsB